MKQIPYINYQELDEFYTISQLSKLFGISKQELKENVNSSTSGRAGMKSAIMVLSALTSGSYIMLYTTNPVVTGRIAVITRRTIRGHE